MKRIVIILAVLAVTVSGCASGGTKIGGGVGKEGSSKIPTTPPPTTAPPTKKPPTKKPPTVKPDPGYKGYTIVIEIKSSADGYVPRERRLRVGDTIIFKNSDPTSEHSFSEDKGNWNSGKLKNGQSWTYKVTAPPGIYNVHDEVVPYVLGGPIEVLPAPKS